MSGARIHFTLDDKRFSDAVQRLGGVLHAGVLKAIGTGLVEVVHHRFDRAREPFGARWHPLLPAYAAIKKGPGILRESGMRGGLMGSITFHVSGSQVTIGSNKKYAAVHQFGATIKPVNARSLVFKLGVAGPKGGTKSGIVRAKSVTIPARPYLGFGPEDQRAVLETVGSFIDRALS
jgi:phage gpG-like protein